MAPLHTIEGIGPAYAAKLTALGIRTPGALLQAGNTKTGRQKLAKESEITEKLILEWVNHADLFRIKGVGSEYADLLEATGVDTVPELATRIPENLYAKMMEINEKKKLVRKMPTSDQVAGWVDQAKKLPRVIEY
jgi:predicted flap endonuclease-1-like 5' DNA nuclease